MIPAIMTDQMRKDEEEFGLNLSVENSLLTNDMTTPISPVRPVSVRAPRDLLWFEQNSNHNFDLAAAYGNNWLPNGIFHDMVSVPKGAAVANILSCRNLRDTTVKRLLELFHHIHPEDDSLDELEKTLREQRLEAGDSAGSHGSDTAGALAHVSNALVAAADAANENSTTPVSLEAPTGPWRRCAGTICDRGSAR